MKHLAIQSARLLAPLLLAATSPAQEPTDPVSSWQDVDGDGLPDLFLAHTAGEARLLRNDGGGQFEDRTEASGLGALFGVRQAAWRDVDGDGLPELLAVSSQGALRLFRNHGQAGFADETALAGLDVTAPVLRAGFADYDTDGSADVLVLATDGYRLFRGVGDAFFEPVALPAGGAPEVLGSAPIAVAERRDEAGAAEDVVGAAAGGSTAGVPPSAGHRAPVTSSSESVPVFGAAPAGPQPTASLTCALTLADQAGGCLEASSDPVLGALHPLGEDFMLEPDGDVGMGTTTPEAQLHVQAAEATVPAVFETSVHGDDLIVEAGDAILGLYSNDGGDFGSGVVLAEVYGTPGTSKWAMVRNTTSSGGRLHFTYGTDVSYAQNADVLVMGPDGRVGIGTSTPSHPLQVISGVGEDQTALHVTSWGSDPAFEVQANHSNDVAAYLAGKVRIGTNVGASSIPAEIQLDPDDGGSGHLTMRDEGQDLKVSLYSGLDETGAYLLLRDAGGATAAWLQTDELGGGGADLSLYDAAGTRTVELDAERSGGGAALLLSNSAGVETVSIDADSNDSARVFLRDAAGTDRIELDIDASGDGRVVCDVLEIRGGADLVEHFETSGEAVAEPGTVMVIDRANPGELAVSSEPYDARVAGVVSGAGGIQAGLRMGQEGVATGDTPVALTGRVYVKCSAENGPIRPGDLLTSAALAGHAMRADDRERSFGAVLGKAMSSLDEPTGLVLVLVNLQ